MKKILRILILFLLLYLFPRAIFASGPNLTFEPAAITVEENETFTIKINLDTDGATVAGAGAKVVFDPNLLSVKSLQPGTIFKLYPGVTFNNEEGKLTISGVVDSLTNQFTGKDTLGFITFQAKPVDNSTTVNFDFVPGSTTDSNIAVTYGTGDILAEVNSLSVQINTDPNRLKADANGDSVVDGMDYTIWLNNFGSTAANGAASGDFDNNKTVDNEDYSIWFLEFSNT